MGHDEDREYKVEQPEHSKDCGCPDCADIGLRVRVLSADKKEELGDGIISGLVDVDLGSECVIRTPKIKLDSGDELYGMECWWISVAEANEIEKKHEEETWNAQSND